jgi:hypothetical protein
MFFSSSFHTHLRVMVLVLKVELAKDAATKATADWTRFVKVLLLVSLPTVVLERSGLVRDCMGSFALLQRLHGTSLTDTALHFFSSLNEQGAKVSKGRFCTHRLFIAHNHFVSVVSFSIACLLPAPLRI